MIEKIELEEWLRTLYSTDLVAVDEGGLTLVAIGSDEKETGAYLEIGGVPEEEEEEQ